MTAASAREEMVRWASGEFSHNDLIKSVEAPERGPECQAMIAVADAAEVQKWAAVFVALRAEPEPPPTPQVADSFEADTQLLGYFGSIYRAAKAAMDDPDPENLHALEMAVTLPPDIEAAVEGPRGRG